MKKIFAVILIVTVGLLFYTEKANEDTIIICSCMDQFRNAYLQEELKQRFPQYNIVMMYMPTGKVAAKVAVEGENTDMDIILALDTGYLSKIEEHLADVDGYSSLQFEEGLTTADNGNKWVTWERFAGAIVVNTDICEKYGISIPESYEDLLKPEYEKMIVMPDPKSSGTGYFFLKSWVNEWGEEKALNYVEKLYGNLKQFTESGSGPINMMIQGEAAIGLAMTYQAVNEINEGIPLLINYPEEGSPYSLSGSAIIKSRDTKKGVKEVFTWLANEGLMHDKEFYSPEKVLINQKNRIKNYPQDIMYANMDGISDPDEKERLLGLWMY